MHVTSGEYALRLLAAMALAYAVGYERQLRGAPAGNRTYALVGIGGALVGSLAQHGQPTAIQGVLAGIGFVGAGLIARSANRAVTGLSSAAAILAVAAIGAAVGQGLYVIGLVATALMLLVLEIPLLPGLRLLDAGRVANRFADDPMHARDHKL